MDGLALMIECGLVSGVAAYLEDEFVVEAARRDRRARRAVEKAGQWLAAALDHERICGIGSMINIRHPFVTQLHSISNIPELEG